MDIVTRKSENWREKEKRQILLFFVKNPQQRVSKPVLGEQYY